MLAAQGLDPDNVLDSDDDEDEESKADPAKDKDTQAQRPDDLS